VTTPFLFISIAKLLLIWSLRKNSSWSQNAEGWKTSRPKINKKKQALTLISWIYIQSISIFNSLILISCSLYKQIWSLKPSSQLPKTVLEAMPKYKGNNTNPCGHLERDPVASSVW
jgi:hypothetical protein